MKIIKKIVLVLLAVFIAILLFANLAGELYNNYSTNRRYAGYSTYNTPRDQAHSFYPTNNCKERIKLSLTYFTEGCKRVNCYYVSVSNVIAYFSASSRGFKGGGFPKIDDINARELDKILNSLPPEPKLPPKSRRVLVSVPDGSNWNTQIYDRANMPEDILELSRITKRSVPSIVLSINPLAEIKAHRRNEGRLALSPDGKMLVSGSRNNDLIVWNPITRVKIFSTNVISKFALGGLLFSPNGKYLVAIGRYKLIVLDTIKWKQVAQLKTYRSRFAGTVKFTHDGKYLVASNPKGVITYRVSDWQTVNLPDLPEDTTTFFSSDDGKLMVIGIANQSTVLWNSETHTSYANISTNNPPLFAAFSPDNRKVAIFSSYRNKRGSYLFRIQIYDAQTGQLIHNLSPNEMRHIESFMSLLWSSDSQYVLGAARLIYVWNINTGRHRGNFVGCHGRITGVALTSDNKTLIAGCRDGKIRFWDFAKGIKKMKILKNNFLSNLKSLIF